ncbi:MAG: AGE family epimerase/isomerase [Woeseiaceae bacterium]
MPRTFDRAAALAELRRITDWWLERAPDREHGGFLGEIDYFGQPVANADKGIILNSRLLWFFSEVARQFDDDRCHSAARRAFDYLLRHFDDAEHGGAVWRLAADGSLRDGKKQVYAQCFCIYAYCAWFDASSDAAALARATDYVELLERHALDDVEGGYLEAFTREWEPLDDTLLGPPGLDVRKTMNTHLHLLEAYTAVHRSAPTETSARRLRNAIDLMRDRILDRETGHLRLFFDAAWHSLDPVISFGHDIEASWLLFEAGEALGDEDLLESLRSDVLLLATTCREQGLGPGGHVCNEFHPQSGRLDEEAIWWVQAEGLVGFLNAFLLGGDARFRSACDALWRFVCHYQVDAVGGDWHWFAESHGVPGERPYKVGFWKGPYHNGRAMMETLRLFDRLAADG